LGGARAPIRYCIARVLVGARAPIRYCIARVLVGARAPIRYCIARVLVDRWPRVEFWSSASSVPFFTYYNII
jgi:hypothetical protein